MIALLLALVLQDPIALQFEAPQKAKSEDLKKAAEALAARCTAVGYPGVTAKVVNAKKATFIELARKEGFTPAMRQRIKDKLAVAHPIAPELLTDYKRSNAEADLYPQPLNDIADPSKAKAPPGAKWVHIRSYWGTPKLTHLVWDFRFSADEFDITVESDFERGFANLTATLNKKGLERWAKFPAKAREHEPVLIFYDLVHTSGGVGGWSEKDGAVKAKLAIDVDLAAALKFPSPIQLK